MLLGNRELALGVAGSTLTEVCGDRLIRVDAVGVDMVSILLDDIEEALECEWAWWILLTEETDDEVDLRPRKPTDERRYEPRGVRGAGDSELR